jgi:hypothetical protein
MSIDRSIVSALKLNSSLLAGVDLLVEVLIEGLHLLEIFKLQVQLVDVSIFVSDSKVSFMIVCSYPSILSLRVLFSAPSLFSYSLVSSDLWMVVVEDS